jgi:adenylate cyclase
LTLLQGATFLVVTHANRDHARTQIDASLTAGAQIFEKLIEQRNRQLTGVAAVLARDFAFQNTFANSERDRATTLSALQSLQSRLRADVVLIASMDKVLLFDTSRPEAKGVPFPFPKLLERADETELSHGFVLLGQDLYAMAVTPLLAPDPIAWLCPGFKIDDAFAREIRVYTNLEITIVGAASGQSARVLATTFEEGKRKNLRTALSQTGTLSPQIVSVRIAGEDYLSYPISLSTEGGIALALLQRSLDKELAPYRRLERIYLMLSLGGLVLSLLLGSWIARGVSAPVLELAEGARRIGEGDYQHRVGLKQEDELGLLADSFNHMSEGLAERDRVRDLLGKVVSPAVATELMRKDVVLGGEEREVTVLFSDLRNFTGMCEAVAPQEMVRILNDYFTRMSAIVERHGGIVDKYVGDALMALFGAPLHNPDDPDRALQCALDMSQALDELNEEWKAQGLAPVNIGIGINTDVVVAGNMGSKSRLNYTVIGDGVNLAARLETLTKTPAYATRIIVAGSTLAKARQRYNVRSLGEVEVKGKQNLTTVYALLSRQI